MSSGVNHAMLIGYLGADPDLRATANGQAVADLRVATSRRWNDKNGERQEETVWHRVVVWDRLATNCHRYLQKGSQVFVAGRINNRRWTDREGQDRFTSEIVARQVVFLGPPAQRGDHSAMDPTRSAAASDPTQSW